MLLLVGSVGIISGYAHPFTGQDGKETTSQMGSIGDTSMGRPRVPRRSPSFQIYYDPGLNAVLVSSTSDVGLVNAVIENQAIFLDPHGMANHRLFIRFFRTCGSSNQRRSGSLEGLAIFKPRPSRMLLYRVIILYLKKRK